MARVLILDDHNLVARLLMEELAEDGHDVVVKGDPQEALATISLLAPDILVMDPFLRKRARWDLLREIKLAHQGMPVIIYTCHQAYARDPNMKMAEAFVLKRSSLEEIRTLVQEVTLKRGTSIFPQDRKDADPLPTQRPGSPGPGRNTEAGKCQVDLQKRPRDKDQRRNIALRARR
jgi:DNA-binding NtrC family response regulator